ncbi:hypothetical protein DFH27DRAFT_525684 [Peziza echinospora]|nr:hypothetical protein DFH27DRAFT_525684 [Peziza echinospora]
MLKSLRSACPLAHPLLLNFTPRLGEGLSLSPSRLGSGLLPHSLPLLEGASSVAQSLISILHRPLRPSCPAVHPIVYPTVTRGQQAPQYIYRPSPDTNCPSRPPRNGIEDKSGYENKRNGTIMCMQ